MYSNLHKLYGCRMYSNLHQLSTGGTYLPDTNATSDTQCLPCPIGQYCPEGSTAGQACPRGFYCIGSQASAYQNPCPLGTYGPDLGFDSQLCFLSVV